MTSTSVFAASRAGRMLTLVVAGLLAVGAAGAAEQLSAGDQFNLDQIRAGNPPALRSAAQNIQASGNASQYVSDSLAEEMLKNQAQGSATWADAIAWSCKALAATGNKRYYTAVQQVSENSGVNRKTRGHCERAASDLGGAAGEQYALGMVAAVPAPKAGKAPQPAPAPVAAAPTGSYKPISEVQVDMSEQQVYAISGPPTSTNAYITGKAFIPFNFKGADTHRIVAHYKGQGRVILANTSAYTTGRRVLEVQIDPNESGY